MSSLAALPWATILHYVFIGLGFLFSSLAGQHYVAAQVKQPALTIAGQSPTGLGFSALAVAAAGGVVVTHRKTVANAVVAKADPERTHWQAIAMNRADDPEGLRKLADLVESDKSGAPPKS